jgi:hypothetical protein
MSISALAAPAISVNPAAQLAGLDAQIARYRQQLADRVNCDSAKTSDGQSAIEELSSKIDAAQARLEAAAAAKADGAGGKTHVQARPAAVGPAAQQGAGVPLTASQAEAQRLAPTGALLDVLT